MAEIYLIRHAQASFGTADYDRLSELGCRQADVAGQFLRDIGVAFDAVYAGELKRQQKTAEYVLAHQDGDPSVTIDARLNEIDTDQVFKHLVPRLVRTNAVLEELVEKGKTSSPHFQKALEIVFNEWVAGDTESPGLESFCDYATGAQGALADIMANEGSGKTVGVFTSGGTIATVVAYVVGATGENVYKYYEPLVNCSVTKLLYSGDKVSLSSFNDHLFIRSLASSTGEPLLTYR